MLISIFTIGDYYSHFSKRHFVLVMGLSKNSQSGSVPGKEPFFLNPLLCPDNLIFNHLVLRKFSPQSLPPLRTGLPVEDDTLLMTTWGHQRSPSSNGV